MTISIKMVDYYLTSLNSFTKQPLDIHSAPIAVVCSWTVVIVCNLSMNKKTTYFVRRRVRSCCWPNDRVIVSNSYVWLVFKQSAI